MKTIKLILFISLLPSCALLNKPHPVRLDADSIRAIKEQHKPTTRKEQYYECVLDLNREGFRQSLIGDLCDKTFGSIND